MVMLPCQAQKKPQSVYRTYTALSCIVEWYLWRKLNLTLLLKHGLLLPRNQHLLLKVEYNIHWCVFQCNCVGGWSRLSLNQSCSVSLCLWRCRELERSDFVINFWKHSASVVLKAFGNCASMLLLCPKYITFCTGWCIPFVFADASHFGFPVCFDREKGWR